MKHKKHHHHLFEKVIFGSMIMIGLVVIASFFLLEFGGYLFKGQAPLI